MKIRRYILASIATICLAVPTFANGPLAVLADGKKHKLSYQGDTFKIRWKGDQISVDRMEKFGKNNTSPQVRESMREVARRVTGCALKEEFYTFMTFRLEATLVCSPADQRTD
ncbi:hypothetical protein CG471_10590 [Sphingobium sp. IP1]|uniref:hypothetical protein n=1 Tax=Sphingobium sp. IP1 TaxID=2021637 RepID=UPI000C07D75D|nr:hypothetical protein [Sphingobium sp. IP1]PHP19794.1 hypothetical protein CG471_10590 [Sphingobium sp. IP1]